MALHSRLHDVIVVGAGGAHGSSALYHLAKRGAQVLGLEAQPSAPHNQGSSHGLSRIIRLAYFEHPSYVPLLRESFRLWRQLEQESEEKLLTVTGCINASLPSAAASGSGSTCFAGALQSAREHGLQHEVLTSAQVAQRFPAYQLPAAFQTMYEPEGGFLVPEACISAHLRLAQQQGAELLCGAKVLGWEVTDGNCNSSSSGGGGSDGSRAAGRHVQVHTSQASFAAKTLVLAAGGWMPQLVPELQPLLTVERQVVGWFDVAPAQRRLFEPSRFPVFLLQDDSSYFYGFPPDEHGFKVGAYNHLREVTTADSVERSISSADEEVLRRCAQKYFPAANGRLTRAAACTFTNTPDSHFILDHHPRHPEVVLGSACSGHGFKFASVVGSVLADLALQQGTRHDVSLHRLSASRPGQAAVLDALNRAPAGGAQAAPRL